MNWYIEVLKNYAGFTGRARRKEFWMFALINFIIAVILMVIENALGIAGPSFVYSLAVLVPSIAVSIRRLHDTGRSGWFLLLALIPLVGAIILIIFYVQDSQPGSNEYGPNPKETAPSPAPATA